MSSELLIGTVKQVVSGDTIVIRDNPKDKYFNKITVRLSCIKAPKLGRKTKDIETKDEPYAWEAREFLRKKLVGQQVKFILIPNKNDAGNEPQIAKVYFPNDSDIACELVENGLAKVDSESSLPETSNDIKKLFELEEKAKLDKKGQWNKYTRKKIRKNHEEDFKEPNFNDEVVVTYIDQDLHMYAYDANKEKVYAEINDKLRKEMTSNMLVWCSKDNPPEIGKLYAAKYVDGEWYRAEVVNTFVSSGKAYVNYFDYGNYGYVLFEHLAPLPESCVRLKSFTQSYGLACVQLPSNKDVEKVVEALESELVNRNFHINIEYYENNLPYVSIVEPGTNVDPLKKIISEGLLEAQQRKEEKVQSLLCEYLTLQVEHLKKTNAEIYEKHAATVNTEMRDFWNEMEEAKRASNERQALIQKTLDALLDRW